MESREDETQKLTHPKPKRSTGANSGKRPVGRPKTITDMRAYKAERARKYRADKKAAKASSPPKPSIQTTTEERNEE